MQARSASPGELYQLFMDLVHSDHPLAFPLLVVLGVVFGIPIVAGCLILLIEGRPRKEKSVVQVSTDPSNASKVVLSGSRVSHVSRLNPKRRNKLYNNSLYPLYLIAIIAVTAIHESIHEILQESIQEIIQEMDHKSGFKGASILLNSARMLRVAPSNAI